MKKENMDLWMKSSLEGYSSPIPVGGWKGLHQSRRKKKSKFLIWFSAACLVVFAGFGLWKIAGYEVVEQTREIQKQLSTPSIADMETPVVQVPSERPAAQTATITRKNVPIDPVHLEVPEMPDAPPLSHTAIETNNIESMLPYPLGHSVTPLIANPMKEEIQPRFGRKMTVYLEAGMAFGRMSFAQDANLAVYRSAYSSFIKTQDLRQIERSFGFVAYYQGLRRWSLGTGLSLSQNTASGKVDYAYYETSRNLVNTGTQYWPDNTLDQTAGLSHVTTIRSYSIHVPLRFRFQPFAFWGPYMEIGARYAYNFSDQGDWLNPETLQVESSNNLMPKHLFTTEIGFGYQWKLNKTSLSLNYRFSPWSSKYSPIQGRMGASLHGITIQLQMPR